MTPPLYILTGGKSSRFGQDKAFYQLPDGSLWYEHVYQKLGIAQADVVLVQPKKHPHEGIAERVIADTPPEIGPLGGIRAALQDRLNHAEAGWILLASCDLIHPSAHWITQLTQEAGQQAPAGVNACQAVVFQTDRYHPFPSLLHTTALPAIDSSIAAQRRSLQLLLSQIETVTLPFPDNQGPAQANTLGALIRHWGSP